jgi:hypothetical protein
MPPGTAMLSSRAAILTPSPKISLSSMMTSPRWMPMRNSIRLAWGYLRVLVGHAALNVDGASRCINGTGKFDQHTVASGLDDATAMCGDCGVEKRFSESLQLRQRAFLVGADQAAITGDIRRQDSRQSPLYGLAAQDAPRAQIARCCPS